MTKPTHWDIGDVVCEKKEHVLKSARIGGNTKAERTREGRHACAVEGDWDGEGHSERLWGVGEVLPESQCGIWGGVLMEGSGGGPWRMEEWTAGGAPRRSRWSGTAGGGWGGMGTVGGEVVGVLLGEEGEDLGGLDEEGAAGGLRRVRRQHHLDPLPLQLLPHLRRREP